jgi:hypothetical protein
MLNSKLAERALVWINTIHRFRQEKPIAFYLGTGLLL